eukprot:Gb_11783 [translate_table: standard]
MQTLEIGHSALNLVEDLGCISCQPQANQKSCSVSLLATLNHGFNTTLSISNQANERNGSTENNMEALDGNDTHRSKVFESTSEEESSYERNNTETKVLRKQNSHADQIETEATELQRERDKSTVADKLHSDSSDNKSYAIQDVCSEEPEGSTIGTKGIGVLKHVINKGSGGKTSKLIRTEVEGTNSSTQCTSSRMSRAPHRKSSPLNWFPRRKTESYLERKIKMLQEAEGMNATLDETLGDSNPHLSRIEREKLAAQAAAGAAMEARKAALVEASWCRILKAARIPCTLAEEQLQKAEKNAAEAFDAAAALGVVMHNKPGGPKQSFEVETSTTDGGSTHTVSASFETAFEVDKEVARAVKVAFFRLAHLPYSTIKDIFDVNDDACRRMSLDPNGKDIQSNSDSVSLDGMGNKGFYCELSSESEAQTEGELQTDSELEKDADPTALDMNNARTRKHTAKGPINKHRYHPKRPRSKQKSAKEGAISEELIDLMLERVKLLKEEELISLAMIVATCGLSAMLKEDNKEQDFNGKCSSGGLGDILVKHISRLEAEKAAASAARDTAVSGDAKKKTPTEILPDLGSILVKHVSKFEREVQEAKKVAKAMEREDQRNTGELKEQYTETFFRSSQKNNSFGTGAGLESILVKHVSKLEREVQAAKQMSKLDRVKFAAGKNTGKAPLLQAVSSMKTSLETNMNSLDSIDNDEDKENKDVNTTLTENAVEMKMNLDVQKTGNASNAEEIQKSNFTLAEDVSDLGEESLDKVLVKHMSRLEKEKLAAAAAEKETSQRVQRKQHQQYGNNDEYILDKVLVKHISKLEKEKLSSAEEAFQRQDRKHRQQDENIVESLDKVLVRHLSRLEKEKLAASEKGTSQKFEMSSTVSHGSEHTDISRPKLGEQQALDTAAAETNTLQGYRNARAEEIQKAWGGLSLGNSLRRHVSKLELDKAAWRQAEEEDRRSASHL